jgi:hypothetical protein
VIDYTRIRQEALDIGFTAYLQSVFVANPYSPGTDLHAHWADGYDLGVMAAREGLVAANDQGGWIDPSHFATPEGIWLFWG